MDIVDLYLNDLQKTWGYETEELNDIREKMQELANSCFWEGYMERSEELKKITEEQFPTCGYFYGKKEDMEFYD